MKRSQTKNQENSWDSIRWRVWRGGKQGVIAWRGGGAVGILLYWIRQLYFFVLYTIIHCTTHPHPSKTLTTPPPPRRVPLVPLWGPWSVPPQLLTTTDVCSRENFSMQMAPAPKFKFSIPVLPGLLHSRSNFIAVGTWRAGGGIKDGTLGKTAWGVYCTRRVQQRVWASN